MFDWLRSLHRGDDLGGRAATAAIGDMVAFGNEAWREGCSRAWFARSRYRVIFDAARNANAIVVSKAVDFVELVSRLGAPPKLIWLMCGNVSNEALRVLLTDRLAAALKVLEADDVVEIG